MEIRVGEARDSRVAYGPLSSRPRAVVRRRLTTVDESVLRGFRRWCGCVAFVVVLAGAAACADGSPAEEAGMTGEGGSGERAQADRGGGAAPAPAPASPEEIASALDNYRVLWEQRVVLANAECDTGWRRQVGDAVDGVDSVALVGGCPDEIAEILGRVEGPVRLVFHWNAEPGTGDVVAFEARPAGGGEAVVETRADDTGGWEQVEVVLDEAVDYELAWSYLKDGFDDPAAGPSGVALDRVTIEGIDGSGYGEIGIDVSEAEEVGSRELAWSTLPGRDYQLFWKWEDGEGAEWERGTEEPMRADGGRLSVTRPRLLYENRVFRVELVEPPSFVRVPDERAVRRMEGSRLSLAYEIEGAGDEVAPVRWIWTFRGSADGEPEPLPGQGSTLELGPLTEEDEGVYSVTVTNGAGHESAPPVTVEVFQPPVVRELRLRVEEGEAQVVRVAPELEEGTEDDALLLGDGPPLVLNVEPGGRFEIAAEIRGSPPLTVRWQRLDAARREWRAACRGGGIIEGTSSSDCDPLEEKIEDDFGTVSPLEGEVAFDSRETASYRLVVTSPEWGGAVSPTVDVGWAAPPGIVFVPDGERIDLWEGDVVRLQAVANPGDGRRRCYQWFVNSEPQRQWADRVSVELRTEVAGAEREFTEYKVHGWSMDTAGQDCAGAPTASSAVAIGVVPLGAREIRDLAIRLLPVRAGSFRMGATRDARGAGGNEQPIRDVALTHSFWLQSAEVSGNQWSAVMGPSGAPDDGAMPATVTHDEAMRFIGELNERERAAGRVPDGWEYALPTEAQWERAARLAVGEVHVPGYGVSTEVVAVMDAHRAGEFRGLLGNVWEWAADWYASAYDPSDTHNPTGPETGLERSLRGGGVDLLPEGSIPTARYGARPDYGLHGFRVALVRADPPETLIIGSIEPQTESVR